MRRRSGASAEPAKARRRKAATPKRRNGPKTVRRRSSSAASLSKKVALLARERDEVLEQRTAISDILRVISNSPSDVQPVLDTVAEHAARICEAHVVDIAIVDNEVFRIAASFGELGRLSSKEPAPLDRSSVTGRSICDLQPVHIADMENAGDEFPLGQEFATRFGHRTILSVPLIREGRALGAILVRRTEVRPFEQKHIALLTTFADQAALAIDNVRLFEAEQQRTRELTESLEQQTATSEVLQVISSSPGDLQPVFATMLEKAVRICDAKFGNIYRWDGDALHLVASHNVPPAFADARRRSPRRPSPEAPTGRMIVNKMVIHTANLAAEQTYTNGDPDTVTSVEVGGVRSLLSVPMLKENELIGGFTLSRHEVRPFTDKQIDLVTSFAAQAVIAIENARLLNELRQRTEELGQSVGELQALGEVSQAVNSTLDLETVLSTIVAKAVQLSGTEAGAIYVFNEVQRELHLRATYGMDQELIDALARQRIGLDETTVAQALAEGDPVQIADLKQQPSSAVYEIILHAGFRAVLVAPLLRGQEIVGLLVVRRRTPGTFPQNTIDLIKTFAAQSAVAIENARLFKNVQTSLEDLRTTQDRLVQTQKLASLGQLTAGIAHEIKNPLNFVNNFSAVSVELIDELREALGGAHLDSKLRAEISEIADTLQGNLDKVVQHGKRADAIVKNMLLHSRQGSGEHRLVDINALVDESLNLAYHGARAEKQDFTITMERSFDPAAGEVDLFPQEITRALLNLMSNGFYAATKRKAEANGGNYEPTLTAATKNLGDSVEITIRDNGSGIPPEAREKLFNPFFTTKPAGEGTGLGLSISHDIIVKQHGGSIEVDTQPGEFTEFRIVLPRAGASLIVSR
jgi:two-component system, NtrC family, sensor kinase